MSGEPTLRSQLLRGGMSVAAGAVVCRLIQLVAYAALARQLLPSEFGAFALAATFVNALALFPGMGLSTALLARQQDPRAIAPSALTAALVLGGALAVVAVAIGAVAASSRGTTVGVTVAVLGVTLVFQGAGAIAGALLDRELRFKARAAADIAGGAAFLVVALASALLGLGAISLALGLVASSLVTATAACGAARLRPARRPDFASLRGVSQLGAVVLATALLQWLFVSSDVWIVERRFGRDAVGWYGVAFQLALLPATTIGLLSGRLALPALVRARERRPDHDPDSTRLGFLSALRVALLLGGCACALLAVGASPIVTVLYGDRFEPASVLVPPLSLYSLARILGGLAGPLLLAGGHAHLALQLVLAQNLLAIPLAWCLPYSFGAHGTAVVYAIVTAIAGVLALFLGLRALHSDRRAVEPVAPSATSMTSMPGVAPTVSRFRLPIAVVVPCFERPHALARSLPSLLRQPVAEILIVDDGSEAPIEPDVLALARGDERVRVLRLETNRGSAAARNAGADATWSPFVLFGDDDVVLADDYASTLLAHMHDADGADVAAGRRLWLAPGESIEHARRMRARRVPESALVDRVHFAYDDEADFEQDHEAPLIGAMMLVRRRLLDDVRYDEELFKDSGFREETDFQVQARCAGARLLACPHALCFNLSKQELGSEGGQRKGRLLAYEWNRLRNDAAFRRKHFTALRDELGFTPGPTPWLGALRAWLGFRVPSKVRHLLGKEGP